MTGSVRQHNYAPHSTTGGRTHPGPVFVSGTKGQLTYYTLDDACTAHVVTAGHGFVDSDRGHVGLNTSE